MAEQPLPMPQGLRRRVMRRWAQGERPLVLAGHGSKPTKVYGLEEYKKMMAHPQRHKPWEQRKANRKADPLGAVEGTVHGRVSRKRIYEED